MLYISIFNIYLTNVYIINSFRQFLWKGHFNATATLMLFLYLCNCVIVSFNNLWYIFRSAVFDFSGVTVNPFISGLYLVFPFKKAQCFGVKILSILVIKEKILYLLKYTCNLLTTTHFWKTKLIFYMLIEKLLLSSKTVLNHFTKSQNLHTK